MHKTQQTSDYRMPNLRNMYLEYMEQFPEVLMKYLSLVCIKIPLEQTTKTAFSNISFHLCLKQQVLGGLMSHLDSLLSL